VGAADDAERERADGLDDSGNIYRRAGSRLFGMAHFHHLLRHEWAPTSYDRGRRVLSGRHRAWHRNLVGRLVSQSSVANVAGDAEWIEPRHRLKSRRDALRRANFLPPIDVRAAYALNDRLIVWAYHVETRKGAAQIAATPSGFREMMKTVRGVFAILGLAALAGCASNPVPPANSVRASFDAASQAVQIVVSNAQLPSSAALIAPDGNRYSIPLTLVSAPHVNYSAPPSVGLGLGGFGAGVGGGLGLGLPLGNPRPTGVDDQYVASISFAAPADYAQRWQAYRVEVQVGAQSIMVPVPAPVRS
jgi:hypothetical protein